MSQAVDWSSTRAAIWRSRQQYLRPVSRLDSIRLESLVGVDRQKRLLVEDTERFLGGKLANNALLWGGGVVPENLA